MVNVIKAIGRDLIHERLGNGQINVEDVFGLCQIVQMIEHADKGNARHKRIISGLVTLAAK